MTMRLQELHPSLVHFPIAFLPLSIGCDLLGRVTGSRGLAELGRRTMPLAAASAVVAAAAGLVAQEEVRAEGEAHDMLVTHRNLNLGLVATSLGMALWRSRREQPSAGYLLLGLLGLGAMSYTAYLGGHMVYEHGVGVAAAGGLQPGAAPELTPTALPHAAAVAAADLERAIPHVVEELGAGEIAPTLRPHEPGSPEERG